MTLLFGSGRFDRAGWPPGPSIESIRIRSADTLVVHKADASRVVIVEYEVHGTIIATGAGYDNRLCSIITIEDHKIARWRDYMDSHAAWKAMTAAD